MEFFVLGDRDTVLGFRLAGVSGVIIESAEQGREILSQLIKEKHYGIIIVTEKIGKMINIEEYTYTLDFPLIVDIPDREGYDSNKKSIEEILRKTIGIAL